MQIRQINWYQLLSAAARKWSADNCLRLGASLSYYTLFSIFPLILVILAVAQLVLRDVTSARDALLDALATVTGGFRDEFIAVLTAVEQSRATSGIVGAVALLLGASWVFGELLSAFNIIWGVEAPAGGGPGAWVRMTFFSFGLVFAGAFLLLVSMVVTAVLTAIGIWMSALPGGALLWTIMHLVIQLVVLTLLFAALLKYLPQTRVAWGDVWIGAVLTAVLWALLQLIIAAYITWSNYGSYGAVGAVLALVAWVYLSSQILFLGAELTAVFARSYGSRKGEPAPAPPAPPSDRAPLPGQGT
ncbi:MAG: YihY/virulence factor BrkB family protein [Chloroflexales bacterium]|nr:YihY/virulence factor BrkB family protein [Chloroflexales bacterium]